MEDEKELQEMPLSPLPAYVYTMAMNRLKDVVEGKNITPANICVLVTLAMQIAEDVHRRAKVPKLKGEEKKQLVTQLIRDLVAKAGNIDESEKSFIQTHILPQALSGMIDSFCSMNLEKVSKGLISGLMFCCSALPEQRQVRKLHKF